VAFVFAQDSKASMTGTASHSLFVLGPPTGQVRMLSAAEDFKFGSFDFGDLAVTMAIWIFVLAILNVGLLYFIRSVSNPKNPIFGPHTNQVRLSRYIVDFLMMCAFVYTGFEAWEVET
jgi:hypothetical protein